MNNFREGLNALKEISDPEKMKMALERITGKKLADYESIDALIGALMGYYNKKIGDYLEKGNVSLEFNSAEKIEKLLKGNSGVDSIRYIQDSITKEAGKGYTDKTTGKLYRCIKQAPASITTPNAEYFEPADNISLSNNNNSNSKWREVTSSRTPDTDYTNNNSYPIHVSVSWWTYTNGTNGGYLTVDGVITACEANQGVSGIRSGVWTVVPPGGVYRFTGPPPAVWSELY